MRVIFFKKSSNRTSGDRLDQQLKVPVHGQCGEKRSLKVQPSTRPGIESGSSWLAIGHLTNCVNLALLQWPKEFSNMQQ